MTVALDTMALIWGIQSAGHRRGNPHQPNLQDMLIRSAILLDILEEKREKIVVPTVAVSELLIGVELDAHANFIAELQRRFSCPPFDIKACSLAAWLWIKHKGQPKDQQLERTVLKSDVMIIATAKVAGATVFYSNEPRCRALASLVMTPDDLPLSHPDMFKDAEIKARFANP